MIKFLIDFTWFLDQYLLIGVFGTGAFIGIISLIYGLIFDLIKYLKENRETGTPENKSNEL